MNLPGIEAYSDVFCSTFNQEHEHKLPAGNSISKTKLKFSPEKLLRAVAVYFSRILILNIFLPPAIYVSFVYRFNLWNCGQQVLTAELLHRYVPCQVTHCLHFIDMPVIVPTDRLLSLLSPVLTTFLSHCNEMLHPFTPLGPHL